MNGQNLIQRGIDCDRLHQYFRQNGRGELEHQRLGDGMFFIFLGRDEVQVGGLSLGVLAVVEDFELSLLLGADGDLADFWDEGCLCTGCGGFVCE